MNNSLSREDVLIALDQLDQTVEVMSNIIQRLKRSIDEPLDTSTTVTNQDQDLSKHSPFINADKLIDPNLH